ncbi:hypothetical protein NVP1081O_119 [Vibrio phage 1.081.O._10N.286.52.C2]|nr:hypothetical protein NVP1081O_119 [Vibrio phage 1.081.O._10N.286.52.C2]
MRLETHIKSSMVEFALIFPTRFSVLEHMFAVNGNGLEINKDGFLDEHREKIYNRDEVTLIVAGSYQSQADMYAEFISELELDEQELDPDEKISNYYARALDDLRVESEAEIDRLTDIDAAYAVDPDFDDLSVYGWGSNKDYIPFYKFENAKYEDLVEQLEYFRDCIMQAAELPVPENASFIDQYRPEALADWKANIGELNAFIEKVKQ